MNTLLLFRQSSICNLQSAIVLLSAASLAGAAPKKGDVALKTSFATPEERKAWSEAAWAQWAPGREGGTALCVTVPAGQEKETHMVRLPLDLAPYRGCKLYFECFAKAEGVTQAPEAWNGVKFMLHYSSPASGQHYQNENNVYGTFDWKALRFAATIADDATAGEINLGLQGSSGKVWFGDITVTVIAAPRPPRPKPAANPGPAFKGHNLPRLRGCMSPNSFRDEDLRVLGQEWNANLIRWQMTRRWGVPGTDRDLDEYNQWIDGKLAELDKALVACNKYGIKVVVDLHSPPGGRYKNNEMAMFQEPLYQKAFVAVWQKIARKYRGNKTIWGYDLVNEPLQVTPSPPGVEDYLGTQVLAAKAIRAIDPDMPIIIEANEWDSAAGYRELDPVNVPKVIYQVHVYSPGQFTHQGVSAGSPTGIVYPGKIGGEEWNKERIRKELEPVREFQLAYNVHIYCGEFSAIRWAPGDSAYRYLKDCIEVFEEYGWDWSYHAFREWDGWSVEHGPDPNDHQPTAQPTDRKKLLLEWFARNKKP